MAWKPFFFVAAFLMAGCAYGYEEESKDIVPSTNPVGSSFYRHLAHDYGIDIRELVKFERRGFGRTEIVALVMISTTTGKSIKDYGRRRLRDKVTLKALAQEAGLDYGTLYRVSRTIKEEIESRSPDNLPPPVFDIPTPEATPPPEKKEKRKNRP